MYMRIYQCEYCNSFCNYANIGRHTQKCIKNPNSQKYKEQNEERICERCKCSYTLNKAGSTKRFCSRSCANVRDLSDETKLKIGKSVKNYLKETYGSDYVEPEPPKPYKPPKQPNLPRIYKYPELPKKFCSVCNKQIDGHNKSGYCREHYVVSDETRETLREAGKRSAHSQRERRRSKIEALFFEKIKNIFEDAEPNKILVDGWDTDIFLPTENIAIFWNGKCHYYPIFGQKSLNQTQNRDRIKKSLFEKAGYIVYIIKDVDEAYPKEIWKSRDKRTDVQLNRFLKFLSQNFSSIHAPAKV